RTAGWPDVRLRPNCQIDKDPGPPRPPSRAVFPATTSIAPALAAGRRPPSRVPERCLPWIWVVPTVWSIQLTSAIAAGIYGENGFPVIFPACPCYTTRDVIDGGGGRPGPALWSKGKALPAFQGAGSAILS